MIDSLKNEIKVMRELKSDVPHSPLTSKHVVRMYDVFQAANQTYMVIEFCPDGDLRKFISKNGGLLSEAVAVDVLKQLMKGFEELIAHNYIHRDIKPENALVKNGLHKVADFGFATKVDITGRQLLRECVGTPLYMSPQLLSMQPYTAKSDIWSIGMLYFEMLYGKTPWSCRDQKSFLKNIQTYPLKFPYDKPISANSKDFL
jgi:calcium-dependent protein kinase